MAEFEIVENPRRKRRKTKKRAKRRVTKRRRRNPSIAKLNNPRRRYRPRKKTYRRRRRNPRGINIGTAVQVAIGGGLGVGIAYATPWALQKVWPGAPRTGWPLHLIKAGGVVVSSFVVDRFLKQRAMAASMLAGGLGVVAFGLVKDYLLPADVKMALSGAEDAVTYRELEAMGISGTGAYIDTRQPIRPGGNRLDGYMLDPTIAV